MRRPPGESGRWLWLLYDMVEVEVVVTGVMAATATALPVGSTGIEVEVVVDMEESRGLAK